MIMTVRIPFLTLFAALAIARGMNAAAGELIVEKFSDRSKLVPVSVEGFTGEAAAAIRFDLEVAGFEITTPDKAMLLVSGSSGGSLTGRVTDRNRNSLLSKQYTGASTRAQAHAFSDDIVALLPGRQGIARTKIAFRVEVGGVSEIYLADYDGYNAVPVTQDKTINRDVAWVPGQRILYYTSYRLRNPFVYSHNLQSGARQLIAGFPGINAAPAVSRDGRRVAMILSKGGSPGRLRGERRWEQLETAHEQQGRRVVPLLVAGRAQALLRLAGGRVGAALHDFRGRRGDGTAHHHRGE